MEEDVVIPEVTVHQLPRQPGHQAGFAGRDQLGEPLRLAGHPPLVRRRVPAPDPGGPGPGAGQHGAGFDVVGELNAAARRGDFRTGEQGVDAAQQWQPAGQPRRGVHPPVVRDVPFHLDQPPGCAGPPGAIAGHHQRRARHPGGIQLLPGVLDGLQPGRADRGPVRPHHQPLIPAADQQVQVQAAAQVTAALAGDCPPGGQHLPQLG